MKYKSQMGPMIKVDFYLEKKAIVNVDISCIAHPGTCWEIIGQDADSDYLHEKICRWMQSYCIKGPFTDQLPLKFPESFSVWTIDVLQVLKTLPFGKWMGYQELAIKMNKPKAARAVGNACGRNPFPLILPCHRILTKSGRLGGYSEGISIKERLLKHEEICFKS